MTPQERQLIDDLFDRLARLESAKRDPEAMSAIMQGLRNAPNAVYALVQTALVQDEALKRADMRIQELDAGAGQQAQSGGFLASMRAAARPGTPDRFCSRASRPDNMASRPTASLMAARSNSRLRLAVAARSSERQRRPRPAWSADRCWPAASAR